MLKSAVECVTSIATGTALGVLIMAFVFLGCKGLVFFTEHVNRVLH